MGITLGNLKLPSLGLEFLLEPGYGLVVLRDIILIDGFIRVFPKIVVFPFINIFEVDQLILAVGNPRVGNSISEAY